MNKFTESAAMNSQGISISSLLEKNSATTTIGENGDVIVIDDTTDIEDGSQEVTLVKMSPQEQVETPSSATESKSSAKSKKDEEKPPPKKRGPKKKTEKTETTTAATNKPATKRVYKTKAMKAAELAAAMRAAAVPDEPAGEQKSAESNPVTGSKDNKESEIKDLKEQKPPAMSRATSKKLSKDLAVPSAPSVVTSSEKTAPIPRSVPCSSTPIRPTDIFNLMNHDDDSKPRMENLSTSSALLPSQMDSKSPSMTPGTSTDNKRTKGLSFSEITGLPDIPPMQKELYAPLPQSTSQQPLSKSKAGPASSSKKTDKADLKDTTTKSRSYKSTAKKPKAEEPPKPQLTPEQVQNQALNQALKHPKSATSLPPPKLLDVSESSKEPSSNTKDEPVEEPIIVIHVPLTSPSDEPGSTQVNFNVLKMAESKYGWRTIHPNASKFGIDLNDDDIDDDDMEDDDEDEEQTKETKEPKETSQPVNPQKGKPKIGQYDVEDPFIDDAELVWEEQRASTKDGFFVFYGPLVEEGKNARIEKLDGTVKRGRKRPANGNTSGGANRKKANTGNSRGTTPRPLVPIAPSQNAAPAPTTVAPPIPVSTEPPTTQK